MALYRNLWLKDLRSLRRAHIPLTGGNLAMDRETLNRWRSDPDAVLACFDDADNVFGQPLAWFALLPEFGQFRRFRLILSSRVEPRSEWIEAIEEQAFGAVLNGYRLEIQLPAVDPGAQSLRQLLEQRGWREEGILRGALPGAHPSQRQDAVLLRLLRPEWPMRSCALVAAPFGLFYLCGDQKRVFASGFNQFGMLPDTPVISDALFYHGLSNDAGQLLLKKSLAKAWAGNAWLAGPNAPEPVIRGAQQAAEYFAGQRQQFDLKLEPEAGSDFQQQVWQQMRTIPYGQTTTYARLAQDLLRRDVQPDAKITQANRFARAVGAACGANPLPLFIPCHRVIGKGGKLVGFSGGIEVKAMLLNHELLGLS